MGKWARWVGRRALVTGPVLYIVLGGEGKIRIVPSPHARDMLYPPKYLLLPNHQHEKEDWDLGSIALIQLILEMVVLKLIFSSAFASTAYTFDLATCVRLLRWKCMEEQRHSKHFHSLWLYLCFASRFHVGNGMTSSW